MVVTIVCKSLCNRFTIVGKLLYDCLENHRNNCYTMVPTFAVWAIQYLKIFP